MKNASPLTTIVKKYYASSLVTATLLLVALILAACGSNGGTTTGSTSAPTASATTSPAPTKTTSSPGSNTPTATSASSGSAVPLTSIRMLDSKNGWAITSSAIIKTTDGGLHWYNAGPLNTQIKRARGEFFSTQVAWVVTQGADNANPNAIEVIRTVDGGKNWETAQSSVLSTDNEHEIMGPPDFVNMQDGWVELVSNGGPAAGSEAVEIYRTTDGGQTWSKVSATTNEQPNGGLPLGGIKTGISFKDTQNGWATATYYAPNNAWLYVTHDAGKTWQKQTLSLYSGISSAEYDTTPPVFFGNVDIMPVHITGSSRPGLTLYISRNGGQSWTATSIAPFDSQNTYVFDVYHAWATDMNGVFYRTVDAGTDWQQEQAAGQFIAALSFVSTSEGWAIGSSDKTLLLHTTDSGKTWQTLHYSVQ